jgi:hypothetical protein
VNTRNETELIDLTELYERLCAEEGFRPHGERLVLPRAKWELWQATLLKEYLTDAAHDCENSEG